MPFKLNEIEVFLITYPNYPEEKQITDLKLPNIETNPTDATFTSSTGRLKASETNVSTNLIH